MLDVALAPSTQRPANGKLHYQTTEKCVANKDSLLRQRRDIAVTYLALLKAQPHRGVRRLGLPLASSAGQSYPKKPLR